MQHTLLIRDSVILTFNCQWSGWTVAVEQSRSESRVLVSAASVWCRDDTVAKLIETSTDFVAINVCHASGGLAKSEGTCCSIPPPPWAPHPRVGQFFQLLWHDSTRKDGMNVLPTKKQNSTSPPYFNSSPSTTGPSPISTSGPIFPSQANINIQIHPY